MAHIVYVTYGASSHLNASLQLSQLLVENGHRVTYVSGLDIHVQVEGNGYDFILLSDEAALRQSTEQQTTERMDWWERIINRKRVAKARKLERQLMVQNHEFERVLENLAPDLILLDNEQEQHIIPAVVFGVPVAVIQIWFSTLRRPDMPALNSFLQPLGLLQRRLIAINWRVFLLKRTIKRKLASFLYEGTDYVSTIRAVCQEYGLDFDANISLIDFLPIRVRNVPIIILNSEEFDFPHKPERIENYIGPMINLGRLQTGVDESFSEIWPGLVRARDPVRHPLIYCSIGTYWPGDTEYLQGVIAAAALRPEWIVVLSIGQNLKTSRLGEIPANVHLFKSVPQLEVLQHTDAIITHGGIATINESIWFGVPMLVYSTGFVDQNGCAARVNYHGMGLIGRKNRETSASIISKVETLLHDTSYRHNVELMQSIFQRYVQEKPVLAVIESVLASITASIASESTPNRSDL